MLKNIAMLVGWVLLVVGVLGFVPGITTTDGLLLGIFQVNGLHNIVHIATGLVALYLASKGEEGSQMFFKVFGVIYAIVAVLGFFSEGPILGLIAHNTADTWLHIVIAVVALYLGFGTKKEGSMQTA